VTTVLWLDTDNSAATGRRVELDPQASTAATEIGVDLEIQLSPRAGRLSPGRGVSVARLDADGRTRPLSHADIGFSFAPTHAAPIYEARLARRTSSGAPPLEGQIRGLMTTLDRRGRPDAWRQPFTLDLGDLPAARPARAELPAKTPSSLRVVSYNVLHARPRARPEPFARLLRALDPDVLLVQEWDGFDAAALHRFMTARAPRPAGGDWFTHSLPSAGVAVISAHPIERALDVRLPRGQGGGRLRFVAAVIATPRGRGLFASVHLKCCGASQSPEDAQRTAEAATIHAQLAALQRAHQVDFVVIAGDLNLVGTREPLDTLRAPFRDREGGLRVATPHVLGDGGCHTWRDAKKPFSPGRLDYVLASEHALTPARAFILDTTKLAPQALTRHGLLAEDSAASDHLPVVVDFTRR
jgi:endonuclease/exonuclease/phosphatase family metal-dependent hydrolase